MATRAVSSFKSLLSQSGRTVTPSLAGFCRLAKTLVLTSSAVSSWPPCHFHGLAGLERERAAILGQPPGLGQGH
jgi:hypothetical protein